MKKGLPVTETEFSYKDNNINDNYNYSLTNKCGIQHTDDKTDKKLLLNEIYLNAGNSIIPLKYNSLMFTEQFYTKSMQVPLDNMINDILNDEICGLDIFQSEMEPTLMECQEFVIHNYFKLSSIMYSFTRQNISNPDLETKTKKWIFKANNIKNYLIDINLFISDIYNSKIPALLLLEGINNINCSHKKIEEYVSNFTKDACTSLLMIQNYLWHLNEKHFTDYLNVISYNRDKLNSWKKCLCRYKDKFNQFVFAEAYLSAVINDPVNIYMKRLVDKYLKPTTPCTYLKDNSQISCISINNYLDMHEIFKNVYDDWYYLKTVINQALLDTKYFNDVNLDKRKIVKLKHIDSLMLNLWNMDLIMKRLEDTVKVIYITEYKELVQKLLESIKYRFYNVRQVLDSSLSVAQKKYEMLKNFCKTLIQKSLISKCDLFKADGIFNASVFQDPFLIHKFKEEKKKLPSVISEISDSLGELDSYIYYLDYEEDIQEIREIYHNAKIFINKLQRVESWNVTDVLYQIKVLDDDILKNTQMIKSVIVGYFSNSVLSKDDIYATLKQAEEIRITQVEHIEIKYDDEMRYLQSFCKKYQIPIVQNSFIELKERIKMYLSQLNNIVDELITALTELNNIFINYLYDIEISNTIPTFEETNTAKKLMHVHRNIVTFTRFFRVQEDKIYISTGVFNPRIYFKRMIINFLLQKLTKIILTDVMNEENFMNESEICFELFFENFIDICKQCCSHFQKSLNCAIHGLKFIFLRNYQLKKYKQEIKIAANLLICLQLINTHVLLDSYLLITDHVERKIEMMNYFQCIVDQLRISYDAAANTYHAKCYQWKLPHIIYSTYQSYYGVSIYSTVVLDKSERFWHKNDVTDSFSPIYHKYTELEQNINLKPRSSSYTKETYVRMHYFKTALSLNHISIDDVKSTVTDFHEDLISQFRAYEFLRKVMSKAMIWGLINTTYSAQMAQYILQHFLKINNKWNSEVIKWRDLVVFVLLHSQGIEKEDHVIRILDIINPEKFSRYFFKDFWIIMKQVYKCLQFYANEPWYNYIMKDKIICQGFSGNELKYTRYVGGPGTLGIWIKAYIHIIHPFQLAEYYTIFENVDYGFQCHRCKNNITRMLYKCVHCSEIYFCENCFEIPADIKSHKAYHLIQFITEKQYENFFWKLLLCACETSNSRNYIENELRNYLSESIDVEEAANTCKFLLEQVCNYKSKNNKIFQMENKVGCFVPKIKKDESRIDRWHKSCNFSIVLLKKYLSTKGIKYDGKS